VAGSEHIPAYGEVDELDQPDWDAMMTSRQFAALESRLDLADVVAELASLKKPRSCRTRDALDVSEV
jgi:hypothetical protein